MGRKSLMQAFESLISCLGHVYQVLRTHRWSMVTVIIGIILEIYGWWLRYLASFDPRC